MGSDKKSTLIYALRKMFTKKYTYFSNIHYQNGWLHTIRTYEKILSTLIAIGNNSKREMNYETEQKK